MRYTGTANLKGRLSAVENQHVILSTLTLTRRAAQDLQGEFFAISITHRQDALYPAMLVGIPPMEDFYIGGASLKGFLPIFKMNFPENFLVLNQEAGAYPLRQCHA